MAAAGELEKQAGKLDDASISTGGEAQLSDAAASKRGGWITFPLIAGTVTFTQLANGGWLANLIVYLIKEFNISSITAAKIGNVVNGSTLLFPVIGAIIADSFSGSFTVIWISTFISLLGLILLTLTASLDCLSPQPCEIGSSFCKTPSYIQFAVLYVGIALACIGIGGSCFTVATIGANQLDKPKNQEIFFNWFFVVSNISSLLSATVLVYVEDTISWRLGFGLCVAANFVALVIFLSGKRFYRCDKPQGSPFLALARVIVPTIRKSNVVLSSRSEDYYQEHNETTNVELAILQQNFRFLYRAAFKTEEDIRADGSIAKSWRLSSVQQVEDLKTLIKIFPLWSSNLILNTTIGVQTSLTILQALTMDRHLGPHFKIPAGSIIVIVLLSSSIFLAFIDRLLCPLCQKLTRRVLSPFQKIGIGHVLNAIGMMVSALVESKRLKIAHANAHHSQNQPVRRVLSPFQKIGIGHVLNAIGMMVSALVESKRLKIAHANAHHSQNQPVSFVPMLALWLFPQLILAGMTEAFYFPGQVALYYQEFPVSLRSTATAMIALVIGIGLYLGTALIDIVRRVTAWLPDNINNGRLDNVYWILVVLAALNFGYYLVCSWLYEYRNTEKGEHGNSGSVS
ncbi:protein NRT1/ PTR FAMILY 2.7-like [Melia azedarach]|uniref:Protein NRT1/ PTR FAMILY 2.7-like n=1 Tax=Melia azedarach TaxID=155640 RepID=A0ACC1YTJ9_MELAZ|nr:protein NRT1/ PTR FAMILY 2.7-like [Melia azedarach]